MMYRFLKSLLRLLRFLTRLVNENQTPIFSFSIATNTYHFATKSTVNWWNKPPATNRKSQNPVSVPGDSSPSWPPTSAVLISWRRSWWNTCRAPPPTGGECVMVRRRCVWPTWGRRNGVVAGRMCPRWRRWRRLVRAGVLGGRFIGECKVKSYSLGLFNLFKQHNKKTLLHEKNFNSGASNNE